MNFALITNGTVFNLIVASQDFITNNSASITDSYGNPLQFAIDVTGTSVDINWTYDGTNFYPPVEND
jgi:hypothetical protein